jgi:predicted transcriptional regulator
MNEQQLISHIEELGLSNKEARVYVACLRLGPSVVQRIADQSGIKRVTTYVILESLVGLGLVSQSIKGKKTYFIAEDPNNLERLLEKREVELNEQKHSFEQILPELSKLKTVPKELPEVKFYDSSDGVRSLFANFFAEYQGSSQDLYEISNIDQVHVFFPERTLGRPNPDRVKYNVKSHLIYTSEQGPIYEGADEEGRRESRFVPIEAYPVTSDVSIFGDYVIMISFAEDRPVAVTIRNAELARAMKAVFDMSWTLAEKFNKPA